MNILKTIILSVMITIGGVYAPADAQQNVADYQYRIAYELDLVNQEIAYIESFYPNIPPDAYNRLAWLYKRREYLVYCFSNQC